MSAEPAVLWLRAALRLRDNPVLAAACAHGRCHAVYVVDPAEFGPYRLRHAEGHETLPFRKTGPHRARFLLECLADLRAQLRVLGSDFAVRVGDPREVVPAFAKTCGAGAVYVDDQPGTEEQALFADVRAALPEGSRLEVIWEKTVYHPDQLPFAPADCPERFKYFWDRVTKSVTPHPEVPAPDAWPVLPQGEAAGELPTMTDLGYDEDEVELSQQRAYPGGETAGLERLHLYGFGSQQLTSYRWTRNRSLGPDYSSKLSVYLALGCVSARHVWREVRRYETEVKKNASTYWLIRELIWRDFYQVLWLKYPRRSFWPSGIRGRGKGWREDRDTFAAWRAGRTGIPFLDAHMRELAATGFMSNRGRVNAASWLSRDQQVLWTWGAAWFESQLLDYDVASNWLNWNFQATMLRPTNPIWQGMKYDRDGAYVRSQLPELADLPAPLVHGWFALSDEELRAEGLEPPRDYPRPREVKPRWWWALSRIAKAAGVEAHDLRAAD